MRILVATDAWKQVNGVANTYKNILSYISDEVFVLHQGLFFSIPTFYPGINLAMPFSIESKIKEFNPTHIHIATEGPIGFLTRRYCLKNKLNFTSSFHTKFAEYFKKMFYVPERITWRYLKYFHSKSLFVFVPTKSIQLELKERGFKNLLVLSKGVDSDLFRPRIKYEINKKPILLYVGRISQEKNIDSFLNININCEKWVVGDGPHLNLLKHLYPNVKYFGELTGNNLAKIYSLADIFVFPSKTDTFGIVLLEALSSGLPIAAYPCPGPIDILTEFGVGFMNENLEQSIRDAIKYGDSDRCRKLAKKYSWEEVSKNFKQNLVKI